MVQIAIEEVRRAWDSRTSGQTKFDAVFCENSPYKNIGVMKKFLMKTLLAPCCSMCSITEWRGTTIELHLDHINGDHTNHTVSNLRLLCPNCHSQTGTYCRGSALKNKLCKGITTIPKEDFIRVLRGSSNIRQALLELGIQAHGANYSRAYELAKEAKIEVDSTPITLKRPSKEELLSNILEHQCTAKLAQLYEVSRSSIRAWLSMYEIPWSRNNIGVEALVRGISTSTLPPKEVILKTVKEAGGLCVGALKLGLSVKRLRKILLSMPEDWNIVKQELALRPHTRKVSRPGKEELEEHIKNKTPFLTLGRKYGVSDNAVRKWAKRYDIKY